MSILSGWALLGILAAVPPSDVSLDELLKKLGAEELRKEQETCSYKEQSLSEELSEENVVEGSVRRTAAVTRTPDRIERQLLTKEKQGEVSSAFDAEPKEDPGARKAWRNAFHPEEQQLYTFELVKADEQRAVIRYTPHTKNQKKMNGTVEVDPQSGALRTMKLRPSENLAFVDEMAIDMTFASTACGVQPVKMKVVGKGGLPFMKKRFRIETSFIDMKAR